MTRRRDHSALKSSVAVSKRLAYVLRHNPASVGIALDDFGWVDVDVLLDALARHGRPISRAQLDAVMNAPGKARFAYDESGTRIRAHQGHSVRVDLGLLPERPPATLFHGTTAAALEDILSEGLSRRSRHHVHLSVDEATARQVGSRRRGAVVVLEIDAAAMAAAGYLFFLAGNGVWLTDIVPAHYLRRRS